MRTRKQVKSQDPVEYQIKTELGKLRDEDAVIAHAMRILQSRVKTGPLLSDPKTVAEFLTVKLGDRPVEVFGAIYFNSQLRMLAFEELFQGGLSKCLVEPRTILRRAIELNAHSVVITHNHPSGEPEPSRADIELTKHVKGALAMIDVRLVDHIIVAGGSHTSLAARGWL